MVEDVFMISHCFKSTHQVRDQNLPDGPSKSNDMHVLVDFGDCYYDIPLPEITLQWPTLNSQLSLKWHGFPTSRGAFRWLFSSFLLVFCAWNRCHSMPSIRPKHGPTSLLRGALETRVGSVEEEVLRKFQVTDREAGSVVAWDWPTWWTDLTIKGWNFIHEKVDLSWFNHLGV